MKKNILKNKLSEINWVLSEQFGLDIRKFIAALIGLPKFYFQYRNFKRIYRGKIKLKPCFHDSSENSSGALGEYFYQDLFVAQLIYKNNPKKHIDIGSRIDGFVAHLATFRSLDVIDIRPLRHSIKNVFFKQLDIVSEDVTKHVKTIGTTDSLSCLHTLEHIGLGRYGDSLRNDGLEAGIKNISKILDTGGSLYLSVPVGKELVNFNANYVFNIEKVIEIGLDNKLCLQDFFAINGDGVQKINNNNGDYEVPECILALFIFKKLI